MIRRHTAVSTAEPPGSAFAGLALCPAVGFALPPGQAGPVFGQDVWDFSQVTGLPAYMKTADRILDFTSIRNPLWRVVAKEYVAALMLPGHERVRELPKAVRTPHTVQTCNLKLKEAARWLNWLTSRGISRLGDVTEYHCTAYAAERARRLDKGGEVIGQQSPTMARAANVVIELAYYQELFSTDRYPADLQPFDGRAASTVAGLRRTRNGENSTPVVPDEVLQPLLGAALYMVQVLAPHILALRDQVRDLQQPAPSPEPRVRGVAVLEEVVRRRIAEARPLDRLPQGRITLRLSKGTFAPEDPLLQVSLDSLAREAGRSEFNYRHLPALRPVLLRALDAVGVEQPWGRDAATVIRADEQGEIPWTAPIPEDQVRTLERQLRTACIIVTAAVSGMRISEIAELAVGCRLTEEPIPGMVRYRLASKVIKGQPLGGTDDEWIVTEEVHRAVKVAEDLMGSEEPGTLLFGNFAFNLLYKRFRRWVNGPSGQRLGLSPIPEHQVSLRMFRRTLAVALAYRPGGVLATKIALKHVSVATTEGYANRPGGAQSRLLAEVTAEEQQRNLDLTLAEYRKHQQGIQPSGPGARDLVKFFDSVDSALHEQTKKAPHVVLNDQQIRTMLSKRASSLHLGVANYCWFTDPSRALCLKLAQTPNAKKPLIGMCDSTRCPQATHHACHRPVWAEHQTTTKVFLGNLGRGHRAERERLEADLARCEHVLAEIDSTAGNGA
ncbi:site-specific integrase [Streptomyces sp. NPDC096310]|uniref:site-specific integrase n=1 Tax=Streptomyces sp. NPDC096310 TaxID=3366082 RepID=UPI003813CCD0